MLCKFSKYFLMTFDNTEKNICALDSLILSLFEYLKKLKKVRLKY